MRQIYVQRDNYSQYKYTGVALSYSITKVSRLNSFMITSSVGWEKLLGVLGTRGKHCSRTIGRQGMLWKIEFKHHGGGKCPPTPHFLQAWWFERIVKTWSYKNGMKLFPESLPTGRGTPFPPTWKQIVDFKLWLKQKLDKIRIALSTITNKYTWYIEYDTKSIRYWDTMDQVKNNTTSAVKSLVNRLNFYFLILAG